VWKLLANDGSGETFRRTFLVHLLSHSQPMDKTPTP
jgi:hypothetical protein